MPYLNLENGVSSEDQFILKQLIKKYLIPKFSQDALFAGIPYELDDGSGEDPIILSHDIYKNQREEEIDEFLVLNGQEIGKGGQGKVVQSNHAIYLMSDELVIFPKQNLLKILYNTPYVTEKLIQAESAYYSILSSNSKVKLINIQSHQNSDSTQFGFFMRKEEGCTLEVLLKDTNTLQKLTLSDKMDLAISFLIDLENLHNHGLSHNDLKPHNILYDKDSNQLKIIDAGLAEPSKTFQIDTYSATKLIALLFTTNEEKKYESKLDWMYATNRIKNPNPIEEKLNDVISKKYCNVSELKKNIEIIYGEYLKASNQMNYAGGVSNYNDAIQKKRLLLEIQNFKETVLSMQDRLGDKSKYLLKQLSNYLDNICYTFKNDIANEQSTRAAYDFLTAQINKLFEDNMGCDLPKNSIVGFEHFSQEVNKFLETINLYLGRNPLAQSKKIEFAIEQLIELKNDRNLSSDFDQNNALTKFSYIKNIIIQQALEPFKNPMPGTTEKQRASPQRTTSHVAKQASLKAELGRIKSSKEEPFEVINPISRAPH